MSEALDKVRGVRELPLFPLPVVLFPGMPMPLHIFEDRYRQMLADVRAGNNLFALSYFDSSSSEKDMPSAGHVGCVAEVAETQALPDGRSNILAVGVIRYEAGGVYAEFQISWPGIPMKDVIIQESRRILATATGSLVTCWP